MGKESNEICFIFVWQTFYIQQLNNKNTQLSTLFCFWQGSQLRFAVKPMFGPFLTFEKPMFEKLMLTQFMGNVLSAASIAYLSRRMDYRGGSMAAVFNELAISTKETCQL